MYENTLFYKNFTSSPDVSDFQIENDDGVCQSSDRGLLVNSKIYTNTKPQGVVGEYDNMKWNVVYKNSFQVTNNETMFSMVLSCAQCFNEDKPIPNEFISRIKNIHEDYRLCCTSMMINDKKTSTSLGFLITNEVIYGFYNCGKMEVFHIMNKVKCDNPLQDTFKLAIGVSRSIKWYINGCLLYTMPQLGCTTQNSTCVLRLKGEFGANNLESVSVGFGHFSFLDHQLPNKDKVIVDRSSDPNTHIPRSQSGLVMLRNNDKYLEVHPDTYGRYHPIVDSSSFAITNDSSRYKIFGQGMITQVVEINVCVRYNTTEYNDTDTISNDKRNDNDRVIFKKEIETTGVSRNDESLLPVTNTGITRNSESLLTITNNRYLSRDSRTRTIDIPTGGNRIQFR